MLLVTLWAQEACTLLCSAQTETVYFHGAEYKLLFAFAEMLCT